MPASPATLTQGSSSAISERKQDMVWTLSLYGTAIGAGTLFLPIDAGLNGIVPLVIMAILAFPMTYFSHQALCRLVLSGSSNQHDITDVVKEYFGPLGGKLITLLYFFAIFPILLMYSVALTNTLNSFLIHQLGLVPPPRALLAFVLISGLMTIVRFGQNFILKSMSLLVYPFIAVLLFLALHLIPNWSTAILHHSTSQSHGFMMTLWLAIPVLVFSFNHSPIISSFAVAQKKRFGHFADEKSSTILKNSHLLMVGTVMFFVFSCVFSLSQQDLLLAKEQNISILSYLANHFHTPLIAYLAPFIAFIAISKSFLGHYLGAKEGLHGLLIHLFEQKKIPRKKVILGVELFIVLSCWIVATINPNILTMIETLVGPIIAVILFLLPMYAMKKIPSLQKYRHPMRDGFIIMTGLIALSAIIYGIYQSIS